MVQCYIQRKKTGLARLYPTYEVYLKDGEQFLLAAGTCGAIVRPPRVVQEDVVPACKRSNPTRR